MPQKDKRKERRLKYRQKKCNGDMRCIVFEKIWPFVYYNLCEVGEEFNLGKKAIKQISRQSHKSLKKVFNTSEINLDESAGVKQIFSVFGGDIKKTLTRAQEQMRRL